MTFRLPGAPLTTVRVIDTTTGRGRPGPGALDSSGSTANPVPPRDAAGRLQGIRGAAGSPPGGSNASLKVSTDLPGERSLRGDDRRATAMWRRSSTRRRAPSCCRRPRGSTVRRPVVPWPAWEILWDAVSKPPREYVAPRASGRGVLERGPARRRRGEVTEDRSGLRPSCSASALPKAATARVRQRRLADARHPAQGVVPLRRRQSRRPPTTSASARSSGQTRRRTCTRCRRSSGPTSPTRPALSARRC